MNDHEDSREAFEASVLEPWAWPNDRMQIHEAAGAYVDPDSDLAWKTWCRALDWRDSQVCVWKHDPSYWGWETTCGETYCFADEGPEENSVRYCFGCGRRVRIQPATTDNHD